MRVCFVVPFLEPTGGIRAVFEIANRLMDLGHETHIAYPTYSLNSRRNNLLLGSRLSGKISPARLIRANSAVQSWFSLKAPVAPVSRPEDLRRGFDFVVATSWRTAEFVLDAGIPTDSRVYFIQHYETWDGPKRRVDRTWTAPWAQRVVTAPWLQDLAEREFGLEVPRLATYGVSPFFNVCNSERSIDGRPIRIATMWSDLPWKQSKFAVEILDRLSMKFEIDRIAFGFTPRPRTLHHSWRYLENPKQDELRDIYMEADIFVSTSATETGPLPVLEAMAAGTAVVTTDVGSVRIWAGDPTVIDVVHSLEMVEEAIARLLRSPETLRVAGAAASERAATFTWDRTAQDFESALLEIGPLPGSEA